jgi:GNAT superfamily N-acetyltransferase
MSTPVFRQATPADIPSIRALIEESVRVLQAPDYTPEQLTHALATVYTVDTQLIADGTYLLVEAGEVEAGEAEKTLVACGGWSKRQTLYGGDAFAHREAALLDPAKDAARIRAFFVHPAWTRRGLATQILNACEDAARAAGFTRFELGATLTGIPLYAARGYVPVEHLDAPLTPNLSLPIVRMVK